MKKIYLICLLPLLFIFSGCAGSLASQVYDDQLIADPYENINRNVYAFNDALDKAILKPVATGYDKATPSFMKTGVSNFLSNLREPRNFLNNLLQLNMEGTVQSLGRFAFNSTFGLAGVLDIMSEAGIEQKNEDFGQTLAVWGLKPGAYVYLPLFGPSTVRDTVGRVGDYLMLSPSSFIEDSKLQTSHTVINVIDVRTSLLPLDSILEKQVDTYNFVRSGYEQSRMNSVFNGNPPELEEDF